MWRTVRRLRLFKRQFFFKWYLCKAKLEVVLLMLLGIQLFSGKRVEVLSSEITNYTRKPSPFHFLHNYVNSIPKKNLRCATDRIVLNCQDVTL